MDTAVKVIWLVMILAVTVGSIGMARVILG